MLRMPFHYSFTVERWYRDYSSVLIAQKSCRLSIFLRAFAHDRIPVQYFRACPLATVFFLTRSKFAMAVSREKVAAHFLNAFPDPAHPGRGLSRLCEGSENQGRTWQQRRLQALTRRSAFCVRCPVDRGRCSTISRTRSAGLAPTTRAPTASLRCWTRQNTCGRRSTRRCPSRRPWH